MSDAVSMEFIGTTLRAIPAGQRTLRMVVDRIGNCEALMETRFNHLAAQIASQP